MTFTKRLIGILTMMVLGLNVLTAQTIIKGNDRVVKVNKTVITANELENTFNEVNKLSAVYGRTFTKKEVLKTMIDEELLKSEVRKQNLVLDENQVKQEVDQIRYQYSELQYQNNPNFKFNESEFRAYIEKEGNMTYQKFEDKIKDKVLVRQYIMKRVEKKFASIDQKSYPDADLRKFRQDNLSQFVQPNSIEVKHIFLRTVLADGKTQLPASEKAIVKKRMDDILKRIKSGESFDSLCELNSEDVESRDRVNPKTNKVDRGYLGVMPIGGEAAEVVKEQFGFDQATLDKLYALGANKLSDVVESKVGYHIFYIIDKMEERIIPFEESKQQIIQYMKAKEKEQLFMEEYKTLIDDLFAKAEITYFKEEYK